MSDEEFQRARRPEQKQERKALLLDTARELLAAHPNEKELSLNELAKRAGMAKSNVYRYFESREAILLELLRQEWVHWFVDLQQSFGPAATPDSTGEHSPKALQAQRAQDLAAIDRLAQVMAASFARRPLLGQLCSILTTVLEHNVEPETIRAFKLESLAFVEHLTGYLHSVQPQLSPAQYAELFHTSFAALVGLWSLSHPSAAVKAVLDDARLAPFRHDFERDFARHLSVLARGLWLMREAET